MQWLGLISFQQFISRAKVANTSNIVVSKDSEHLEIYPIIALQIEASIKVKYVTWLFKSRCPGFSSTVRLKSKFRNLDFTPKHSTLYFKVPLRKSNTLSVNLVHHVTWGHYNLSLFVWNINPKLMSMSTHLNLCHNCSFLLISCTCRKHHACTARARSHCIPSSSLVA